MNNINTVIFDVGGVLANYNTISYYESLGCTEEKAAALAEATMLTPDWKEYDRGVMRDEEIRARFKKRTPALSEDIDRYLTSMKGLVTKRDTAIPWIRSVKEKGLKVYILSNFSYTAMRDNPEALEFQKLADGCFWSMEHKVIKPDDAAFLTLFYTFQINPQNAVFIDDTQKNLTAAEKFGLRTILYQNQKQAEEDLNRITAH